MTDYELFAAEELAPGEMRSAQLGGIAVLIVRRPDGTFRALRDVCPHLGVPLSRGTLSCVVEGDDVGSYRLSDTVVARCSWHSYEYDTDTGRCVADHRWRVKTYPVTVVGGRVVVSR